MSIIHATTTQEISQREIRNMARSGKIAADGMVLLSNNGVLPTKPGAKPLALFGSGARRTVKGGTGSGDVNSRTVISAEQGLEEAGFTVGTKGWMDRFDEACNQEMMAFFVRFKKAIEEQGWAGVMTAMTDPYRDPAEPDITEADLGGTDRSCAIYIIGRTSGEGSDRKLAEGDYELSEKEKENLIFLTEHYTHTVVVINAGGVIDTKFLRAQKGISAILLMSQAGCAGGRALADVLTGKVTPSGHLTTTWAENYADYPNAETFSYLSGDVNDEYYNEGIYVGYRYFDSFGVAPAYPFGFGLSYTDFSMNCTGCVLDGENVKVSVAVKNTGAIYSGRETVQVYVSQPQGKLDKAYQVLAGFAKTKLLAPGAAEVLTVSIPLRELASYDEEKAQYVLEPGNYYVRVGNHSRNTHVAAVLHVTETIVTAQLKNKVCADCRLNVLKADGSLFYTYPGEDVEKASAPVVEVAAELLPTETATYLPEPSEMHTDKENVITMQDVQAKRATLEELTAQLAPEELAALVGFCTGRLWRKLHHWRCFLCLPRCCRRHHLRPDRKPGCPQHFPCRWSCRSAPFQELCG